MPSLSTRSYAELINLPAYEQIRILHEQKYPKANDGLFKMPYYSTALSGIRQFYKGGNDKSALKDALDKAAVLKGPGKSTHNSRVLNLFINSSASSRSLTNLKLTINLTYDLGSDVSIRLKFDVEGDERGRRKYIFFNCRDAPLEPQIATDALSIACWILQKNGVKLRQGDVEFYDLKSGAHLTISKTSQKSITKMKNNVQVIASLWPNV